MNGGRLPASAILSAGLHAGALFLFIILAKQNSQKTVHAIANVDLLIPVPRTPSARALPRVVPKRATPLTPWNFLKLALPLPQRPDQLKTLSEELPRRRADIMQPAPKLQGRRRLRQDEALQARLTENRDEPLREAPLQENLEDHHAEEAQAELPKLEEIGRRRAPAKLIAALQDARQAPALADSELQGALPEQSHSLAQQAPIEDEPAPLPSASAPAVPSFLSAPVLGEAHQGLPTQGLMSDDNLKAHLPKRDKTLAIEKESKKGVEIDGPLANRKVISYNIPKFPAWASQDGIFEAEVAIRFWVSAKGVVLPDFRIERTSGFGRLDHLAMDALKKWQFTPIEGGKVEWGVITFRFVLE